MSSTPSRVKPVRAKTSPVAAKRAATGTKKASQAASSKKGTAGTLMILIGDVHYGERVDPASVGGRNEYSRLIAKRRISDVLGQAASKARSHAAGRKYDSCLVLFAGDIVEGGKVTPEMSLDWTPNSGWFTYAREFAKFVDQELRKLRIQLGVPVEVGGVSGNHGALTPKPKRAEFLGHNADRAFYELLRDFSDMHQQYSVEVAEQDYLAFLVNGQPYVMVHGDTIPVRGSVFRKSDVHGSALQFRAELCNKTLVTDRNLRSRFEQVDADVEVFRGATMLFGHFHTPIDDFEERVVCVGSLKGYDAYAQTENTTYAPASCKVWVDHPTELITMTADLVPDDAQVMSRVRRK